MTNSKNGNSSNGKSKGGGKKSFGPRASSARQADRAASLTVAKKRKSANHRISSVTVAEADSPSMSDNEPDGNSAPARKRKTVAKSTKTKIVQNELDQNGHSDGQPDEHGDPKTNTKKQNGIKLSAEELAKLNSNAGLVKLLKSKNIRIKPILNELTYENELIQLQIELVKLQRWVQKNGKRIAILFEGRDAAGKGGAIRRFTEHLNPRSIRVVALPKPSEVEQGQWYFQRYSIELPSAGEIVFFDRSWYNRAVVEPVNGFCSDQEYDRFMQQVTEYEHMLYEDGITIIKFWFSISREEQLERFTSRRTNPLKQWKLSPIDDKAQSLWDKYSHYKQLMFSRTHTSFSPWIIVQANNKKHARLESIRYVLSSVDYGSKSTAKADVFPDPNVVSRFHRNSANLD